MARRGGGFPGMGGGMNPQQMMMKVQKMQQQMAQAQEEIANTEITASAGGGMVTVKMTGGYKMVAVEIKPEAVDPDDVDMLQDMVMAAMNDRINTTARIGTDSGSSTRRKACHGVAPSSAAASSSEPSMVSK